jgi:hypothetical protein
MCELSQKKLKNKHSFQWFLSFLSFNVYFESVFWLIKAYLHFILNVAWVQSWHIKELSANGVKD